MAKFYGALRRLTWVNVAILPVAEVKRSGAVCTRKQGSQESLIAMWKRFKCNVGCDSASDVIRGGGALCLRYVYCPELYKIGRGLVRTGGGYIE